MIASSYSTSTFYSELSPYSTETRERATCARIAFRRLPIAKGEAAIGQAHDHLVLHLPIKVFSIALDTVHWLYKEEL